MEFYYNKKMNGLFYTPYFEDSTEGSVFINKSGYSDVDLKNKIINNNPDTKNGKNTEIHGVFPGFSIYFSFIGVQPGDLEKILLGDGERFRAAISVLVKGNSCRTKEKFFESEKIESLEFNLSSYNAFFHDVALDEIFSLYWDTEIGEIILQSKEVKNIENDMEKIIETNLIINLRENKSISDAVFLTKWIERFFITFITKKIHISYPEIKLNNGKIGILIYQREILNDFQMIGETFVSKFIYLKDTFGALLAKYILNSGKYEQAYYLYTFNFYKNNFAEYNFISLAWGMEVLINRFNPPQLPEKYSKSIKDFNRIMDDLVHDKKITAKKSCSLKKRIERSYSLTLKEKIENALCKISNFLAKEKVGLFSEDFSKLRNQLSHYGGKREPEDESYVMHMHELTKSIRILYLLIIMKSCDFPQDLIDGILNMEFSNEMIHEYISLVKMGLVKSPFSKALVEKLE
ncbi:hypothetical protein PY793_10605 [Acetobacter fabarum]|uniref:HEPN domain-containing protein n=1 Tax=Acetobacter fabarum TaxID=483199 RepID=UPI00312BC498